MTRRDELAVQEAWFRAQDVTVDDEIHPEVEKISGLVPPHVDAGAEFHDHLEKKHR